MFCSSNEKRCEKHSNQIIAEMFWRVSSWPLLEMVPFLLWNTVICQLLNIAICCSRWETSSQHHSHHHREPPPNLWQSSPHLQTLPILKASKSRSKSWMDTKPHQTLKKNLSKSRLVIACKRSSSRAAANLKHGIGQCTASMKPLDRSLYQSIKLLRNSWM